jgi:hypothetical protein
MRMNYSPPSLAVSVIQWIEGVDLPALCEAFDLRGHTAERVEEKKPGGGSVSYTLKGKYM